MNTRSSHILTIAAVITVLVMLPLTLNAQHVITRRSTTRPKVEQKSTSKQQPSKPRNNAARRGGGNAMTAAERQRVIDNLVNNMVYVNGGTFTMGPTAVEGTDINDDELPAHEVTLSSFYIGKYEVTQREWRAIMGPTRFKFPGDDHPAEWMSWNACQQFISKLNALTGKHFRLPTEAEWEYAARGGDKSRGYRYPGSNSLGEVAWFGDNCGGTTQPVGTLKPNELGIYDMEGNVREWCQDWYGRFSSGAQINSKGPTTGSNKIIRGGGWNSGDSYCRISMRRSWHPSGYDYDVGFRLAM